MSLKTKQASGRDGKMVTRNDDMGPLPESDRQDTLQQLGLQALRNRLPVAMFLFRREVEEDKGIDGTLEAKSKGQFTNSRAALQLKSTDKPKRNLDGSVSYPIETSNLIYLLNGVTPLYFLWIESDQEMRFAWAREEWRRLDTENPGWKKQETFTVRFREVFDRAAVQKIHDRVMAEAQFGRKIHEKLAREALEERVVVSIDPKTLATDDPLQVFERITSSGMTIVSSGYGSLLPGWLDVLGPAHRGDPRVQLVAACAQVSLGKYQTAFGHLAEAATKRASLSASDQRVLDYLQDVCRYQTGGMDQAEYLRRERQRTEEMAGVTAEEHRMEVLRLEWLGTVARDRRTDLLRQMKEVCRKIQAAEDAAPAHKLFARLNVLFAEADELTGKFTTGAMRVQARQDAGFPAHEADWNAGLIVVAEWDQWNRDAGALFREAEAEGHPLLIAEAITTRLTGHHAFWDSARMLAAATGAKWEPKPIFGQLAGEAERAMEIFRLAGSLEGEIRAKLLLADFRYLSGDEKSARALAEEAMVIAQAWCYSRHEAHAREYTEGPTHFDQFLAEMKARRAQDEDLLHANDTDETLRRYANHSLESMHLPADRLPVVEKEWQSLRLIARERVSWCRHINLKQEKGHTLRPETHYLRDPERFCVCERHNYEGNIHHPDPEAVIDAFKRNYCEGCRDRNPKRG
jgi:hypothetical protein